MFPVHDENKSVTTPYVNYGLLVANIAVFFFFLMRGMREFELAIWAYGAIPLKIVSGEELWRLLTSMFLHADIVHLFGNMVYLWVFGDNIEDALGHGKYLVFYLVGGLAASLAHVGSLYATLPSFGSASFSIPAIGASGAISAVLGAYMLLYPTARIRTVVFYFLITVVSVPALYYLGFWFLYQLLLGFISLSGLSSGVAFWAHIGGFAAGVVAVKAFRVKPRVWQVEGGRVQQGRPITPLVASPLVKRPFIEIVAGEGKLRILAELPGVDENDIRVKVSEWEVNISAERGQIKYSGQIALPTPVLPRLQELTFRNGVLSFYLTPKT